jgi:hypothetical protein
VGLHFWCNKFEAEQTPTEDTLSFGPYDNDRGPLLKYREWCIRSHTETTSFFDVTNIGDAAYLRFLAKRHKEHLAEIDEALGAPDLKTSYQ